MTEKLITTEDVRAAALAWVKAERELEACDTWRREELGQLEDAVDEASSKFDELLDRFREQQVELAAAEGERLQKTGSSPRSPVVGRAASSAASPSARTLLDLPG